MDQAKTIAQRLVDTVSMAKFNGVDLADLASKAPLSELEFKRLESEIRSHIQRRESC